MVARAGGLGELGHVQRIVAEGIVEAVDHTEIRPVERHAQQFHPVAPAGFAMAAGQNGFQIRNRVIVGIGFQLGIHGGRQRGGFVRPVVDPQIGSEKHTKDNGQHSPWHCCPQWHGQQAQQAEGRGKPKGSAAQRWQGHDKLPM